MKKLLVLALASVLAIGSVFAGGQKENTDEIPTLKWVQIGNGMPDNYEAWQTKVNAYLEEKIGCHIDVEVISWGDFKTRRSVIINTNEAYDIIFTAQDVFVNDVMIGAFADISDKVKTLTPDLYNLMPEDYWKATSIDGSIYGVPTFKDSSMTNYWVFRQGIVDKYNLDIEPFMDFADMTEMLEKVTEGEHEPAYVLAMDAMEPAQEKYDFIGSGLTTVGVEIQDGTRTVVPVYEQEEILDSLRVLHEWYEKGIINSDAATLSETPRNLICKVAQGWSTAAETVWGPQMGEPAIAIQRSKTILTNDTVRGSINCINANSKNIDKSLLFLELLNTDSTLRDMFAYGEPDVDYVYTAENTIHRNNSSWPMASYSQATFFDVTKLDNETVDQWSEVKELNNNAIPSVMLGFTMDTESVEDQIANCSAIFAKYKLQVITGASDPDVIVPQMMAELRNAGFDEIVAEAQKQVDAAYNN